MLKKFFFMLLMLTCATSMNAQWSEQSEDAKVNARTEELRQKLNIDYSMPDYSVKNIDEKIIGSRLTKQLQFLMAHYKDHVINDDLSEIPMTFIEGVSDSKTVNSLFSYISRYIKE